MEPWMLLLLLPVAWLGYSFYKSYRSPAQLQAMAQALAEGGTLVDVRTPSEYGAGHAPRARNIPLAGLQAASYELDPDRPVVLYCQSGARSGQALSSLRAAGFSEVFDLGPYRNTAKLPAVQSPRKSESPKPTSRNQRKRQRRRARG